jgi:hypothetical protein
VGQEENGPIEIYADSIQMEMNVYGAVLKFGLLGGPDKDPAPTATVRVSPQMLHVMARMLANASNQYDKDVGIVNIPDTLYAELGLKREL